MDYFIDSRWKQIYLHLFDIDLVEIEECGMNLLNNYTVLDNTNLKKLLIQI